jgi:hypothetical protein
MRSPHRLADPMQVILSFAAAGPLDVRRLTRIDGLDASSPAWSAVPAGLRYLPVAPTGISLQFRSGDGPDATAIAG